VCIREDTFSNNAANRHPSRIGRWTPRDCRQIGQPIDTFQVLQHRMVGMYMELEQAIAAVYLAILHLADEPASRARAVSAAKTTIGRAARFIGQNAVQLHGGMGMTEELAIGHYFKRLTAIQYEFGSADYHLARYAELTNPS
jgi:alkylation response protein AidB-like acyl-CoA dehydrogenase